MQVRPQSCLYLSAESLVLLLLPFFWHSLEAAIVSVTPEADTFVRSATPTSNFGGAGAISVSGSAAVNADHVQNGLFDSLIRFSMSNVVSSIDTSLGTHDWLIYRAKLLLTEVGAPITPVFNRGVGMFEIRWLAANEWTEGTGIPIDPTTDGVTWKDVPLLLDPERDV